MILSETDIFNMLSLMIDGGFLLFDHKITRPKHMHHMQSIQIVSYISMLEPTRGEMENCYLKV